MESNNSDIIQDIEKRFLPHIERMAEEIPQEFPLVKTNVWSWSVGSSTTFQGHDIGLECFLPEVSPDQTNIVMLIIETMHLTTVPKITAVDVCWNDGSLEEELFSQPVGITEKVFKKIELGLPRMYNCLKESIRRGYPSKP